MTNGPGLKRAGISTPTESFPVSVLLNGKELLQNSITVGQEHTVAVACFYLTGYAPHLQFTGIFDGKIEQLLQLHAGAVVGTVSVEFACSPSACVGFLQGRPVPSHSSERCMLAWLEAAAGPWL